MSSKGGNKQTASFTRNTATPGSGLTTATATAAPSFFYRANSI